MAVKMGGSGVGFGGGVKVSGRREKTPDPLAEVEYTGDLQQDTAAELTAMQKAYRGRARAEVDRFREATDPEFWVALVFESREQKEDFLREFGLSRLGDKYLDGRKVARVLRGRKPS